MNHPSPFTSLGRRGAFRLALYLVAAIAFFWLSPTLLRFTDRYPLLDLSTSTSPHSSSPEVSGTQTPSDVLFPNFSTNVSWVDENHKMLQALLRCLETSKCGKNQKKVVILEGMNFRGSLAGWNSGEDIWARSTRYALKNLGVTMLYSLNMERTVQLYQMFPQLVKMVIVDVPDLFDCAHDNVNCILSERNPGGIPIWKFFSFYFWTEGNHPLGRPWTLSPEDYGLEGWEPNTYLGYSVEPTCSSVPFISHSERPNSAYILSKRLSYFADRPDRAWTPENFEEASKRTGVELILGAMDDSREFNVMVPELPGVHNIGLMPEQKFWQVLSTSRALIGVGNPLTSPTPYDALCLGIPFINPVFRWDTQNPKDRSKWSAQHGRLKLLDPPYVYNVFVGDQEGFIDAIRKAVANPIDSYVLEDMRMSAVERRIQGMIDRDWKREAEDLMARRKAAGEEPIFMIDI